MGRVVGGTGWGDGVGVDTGGYGEDTGVDMDVDMGRIWEGDLGPGFGLSVLRMVSLITH